MSSSTADIATAFPYPGLRPFEPHEADIFFGRKQHVTDLLKRLRSHRFLAVVGPSGCGKSSLIRAGLIPALQAGFMASSRFQWNFAVMRPGNQPLLNLATALRDSGVFGEPDSDEVQEAAQLCKDLAEGSRSLADRLTVHELAQGCNLLILVDQFEELFRFERAGGADESRAFVNLLLETARDAGISAYVVITMRTDFLGQCPLLSGLPEAINESQYLTPRLSREQSETAIVGPARMFGGEIRPEVVTQILNAMGTDPDQLPLMQHLLMRMWCNARAAGNSDDDSSNARKHVSPKDSGYEFSLSTHSQTGLPPLQLTMSHYLEAGGLQNALSNHAERVFRKRLRTDRQRQLAEQMFRKLTDVAADGQLIRCSPPPTFGLLGRELSVRDKDELLHVIDEFRADGRSFLMPPYAESITPGTPIDISHESLIRRWPLLENWTRDEARATEVKREVTKDAARWESGGKNIGDAEIPESRLVAALAWSASHSGGVTPLVKDFLNACVRQRKKRRNTDRVLIVAGLLLSVTLGILAIVVHYTKKAKDAERVAVGERNRAESERKTALTALKNEEIAQAVANSALARQYRFQAADEFLGFQAVDETGWAKKGDVSEGLLWLAEALNHEPVQPEASDIPAEIQHQYAVRAGAVLSQHPILNQLWHFNGMQPAAVSADEHFILAYSDFETSKPPFRLQISDGGDDKAEAVHVLECGRRIRSASFSGDGRYILAVTSDETTSESEIQKSELVVWSWPDRSRQQTPQRISNRSLILNEMVTSAEFVQGADMIPAILAIVRGSDQVARVWLWDSVTGPGKEQSAEFDEKKPSPVAVADAAQPAASATQLVVSKEGLSAVVLYDQGRVPSIWNFGQVRLNPVRKLQSDGSDFDLSAISDHGKWMAVSSTDGAVHVVSMLTVGTANERITSPCFVGPVARLQFGPDDRLLTVGKDKTARMWSFDLQERESKRPGDGDRPYLELVQPEIVLTSEVQDVKFSPDGRHLAFGCRDRLLRVIDVQTGRPSLPPLHFPLAVTKVAFSSDARFVTGQTQYTIQKWNLATRNPPSVPVRGHQTDPGIAFSTNGQFMATIENRRDSRMLDAADGPLLSIRDLAARKQTFSEVLAANGEKSCEAISNDGRSVVLRRGKGALSLVRLREQYQTTESDLPCVVAGKVVRTSFSPNGRWLLTAFGSEPARTGTSTDVSDWQLQCWDVQTGKPQLPIQQEFTLQPVNQIAWNPQSDGFALATGNVKGGEALLLSCRSETWNGRPQSLLHPLKDHLRPGIRSVAFSPDGQFLATGGDDDLAFMWRIANGQNGRVASGSLKHRSDVVAIQFGKAPDGGLLFATGEASDGQVNIWQVKSIETIVETIPVHPKGVVSGSPDLRALHFSPSGLLLAVASGTDVRICSTAGGMPLAVLKPDCSVQSIRFAGDSRTLRCVGISSARKDGSVNENSPGIWTRTSSADTGVQLLESNWHLWHDVDADGAKGLTAFGKILAAGELDTVNQGLKTLTSPSPGVHTSPNVATSEYLYDLWTKHGDRLRMAVPASEPSHAETAEICEASGNWFAAAWHRRQAIDSMDRSTSGDITQLAAQYAGLGRAHAEQSQTDAALQAFREAVRLDSRWSEALRRFQSVEAAAAAEESESQEDWSTAATAWTEVIRLSLEKDAAPYYRRSNIYLQLKLWEDAERDFFSAVGHDAEFNRHDRWLERSELLIELKQWAAAARCLQELFSLSPTSENGYSLAVAQLIAGETAAYRKTCADLHYRFAECGDLNDANNAAWVSVLSTDSINPEMLSAALEGLRSNLELADADSGMYLYMNTLGAAYFRVGEFAAAKVALDNARRAYPENDAPSPADSSADPPVLSDSDGTVWDWVFLAMTCQQLGDKEAALKWFKQAEAAAPTEAVTSGKQTAELELLLREARHMVMPDAVDSPAAME